MQHDQTDSFEGLGISKLEKDFLGALPERFRRGAMVAYREKMAEFAFNSTIEAHKCKLCYMDAFVTAVFMTQKESDDAGHNDVPRNELPEEAAVLPLPGAAEHEAEHVRDRPVGEDPVLR